jgi:hypothetical protein
LNKIIKHPESITVLNGVKANSQRSSYEVLELSLRGAILKGPRPKEKEWSLLIKGQHFTPQCDTWFIEEDIFYIQWKSRFTGMALMVAWIKSKSRDDLINIFKEIKSSEFFPLSEFLGTSKKIWQEWTPYSKKRVYVEGRNHVMIGRSDVIKDLRRNITIHFNNLGPLLIWGEEGVGKTLYAQIIAEEAKFKKKRIDIYRCNSGDPNETFCLIKEEILLSSRSDQSLCLILDRIDCLPPESVESLLELSLRHGLVKILATAREIDKVPTFPQSLYIHPLDARREDIPLLVNHFSQYFANLYGLNNFHIPDSVVKSWMKKKKWDKNVHSLQEVVQDYCLSQWEGRNLNDSFSLKKSA